jgi:hypothetical protein
VTELEWLSCDDACQMLAFLGPRASARKRRLHLCGGCRQLWHLLYDDGSRNAVEVGERHADGEATLQDLKDADWSSEPAAWMQFLNDPTLRFFDPAENEILPNIRRLFDLGVLTEEAYRSGAEQLEVADPDALRRVRAAAELAEWCIATNMVFDERATGFFNRDAQMVAWPGGPLIRDIFANPFLPVTFDPRWRTSDAVGLARAIYDERAFDRLPILADALMDAGCDDEQVLAHCRSAGPHVRGCWVVDLVLGKE